MGRHQKTAEQREFYAEDKWMELWDEDPIEDESIEIAVETVKTLVVFGFAWLVLYLIL